VAGVAADRRQRREPAAVGLFARHHHQRRGAVVERRGVARRDRAVLVEGRAQRRELVRVALERLLVVDDLGRGPLRDGTWTAAISSRNLPSFTAAWARR
jgi:hypothetical protein